MPVKRKRGLSWAFGLFPAFSPSNPCGCPCCSSLGVVAPGATPGGVRMADCGWRDLREAKLEAREISAYWSQSARYVVDRMLI